jgi:aminoglycoside/choline kinase family phosphotransferase
MRAPLSPQENAVVIRLLLAAGFPANEVPIPAVLAGDGSDRRFARFHTAGGSVLAVFPSAAIHGQSEARACFRIGSHLHGLGIHVPEIFACDQGTGIVLMEDLGDVSLYEALRQSLDGFETVRSLYLRTVEELARFQLLGRDGFDTGFCWDTPFYDRELMLKRESEYFYREFCHAMLGMEEAEPDLKREFESLAKRAAQEPAEFLLHRDFQSRNIMVHNGDVWFIDFQGARLGPLGYDLASLLVDPYAGLPRKMQDDLISHYLDAVDHHLSLDRQAFLAGYYYLMLQRNLQIVGAFCFLSRKKGKSFFKNFIKPAAMSLSERLDEPPGFRFPFLRETVAKALDRLAAIEKNGQNDG